MISRGFDLANAINSGRELTPSRGGTAMYIGPPPIQAIGTKDRVRSIGGLSVWAGRMVKMNAAPPSKV